jgi:HEAT repeat protein
MESKDSLNNPSLGTLLDTLADDESDAGERSRAMVQLIKLGDARAVIPLKELAARKSGLRWDAELAIESIRDTVLVTKRKALKKRPFNRLNRVERIARNLYAWWGNVRLQKVRDLGRAGDEKALPYLILLAEYRKPAVRVEAVEGLGRIGHKDGIPTLLAAMSDGHYDVCEAAGRALIRIGGDAVEPLIHLLNNSTSIARLQAIKALEQIRDKRAIPHMIECLKAGETFMGSIKEHAKSALLSFNEQAFEPLLAALSHSDTELRRELIDVVKWYKDDRFREHLLKLMDDKDVTVREKAVEALSLSGYPGRQALLVKALSDPAKEIRRAAARVLKLSPYQVDLNVLIRALDDPDETVRADCVEAMTKINHKKVAKVLVPLLWDRVKIVREKCAETLGTILDREVTDLIAEKIGAGPMHTESIDALARLGDTRAVPKLFQHFQDGNISELNLTVCMGRLDNRIDFVRGKQYCLTCYCWSDEFSTAYVFSYNACRVCHSNIHLDPGIKRVKLILDRGMEELTEQRGAVLRINGLKREDLCDIDEIQIIDADDLDVERWVMKLRNDTDITRRDRLGKIPVFLATRCTLSQSKLNLLRDTFKVKMFKVS